MKLTNEQICDSYIALSNLRNSKKLLPVKVSYAIIRNIKTLQPLVESVDSVKLDILTKYGSPNTEKPGTYNILPDNIETVNNQLKELGSTDNEVDILTVKLEILDGYELSIEDMDALYFMLEDSED